MGQWGCFWMGDLARRRWLARGITEVRRDARVWYVPHAKQLEFHAAGVLARERLFMAGNRVGKTLAGAAEVGFHLTGLYPRWWQGVRFDRPVQAWAASVTREATRDILQEVYLGDVGGEGGVGDGRAGVIPRRLLLSVVHKSGVARAVDVVRVRHVSGGVSVLGFKSFDQGRESFQGTAREVIHLDEEPEVEIYEECLLRTMTVQGQILLTMTPLHGMTELVRHFTDAERQEGKQVVRAGWVDAPHLGGADVQRLRKSLRPHEVAARERGEPSMGRGLVFAVDERAVAVPRFEIPQHWRRCVGVDFGWTNPTAAVWLAHDGTSDIAYVCDVYCASERVPAEHAKAILARGEWVPAVCDPAGQAVSQRDGATLVELYAAAGLHLTMADNSVEAGIMLMLERLQSGRLKVFADLLPWWHEFRLYARDARGRVVKRDDHLLDATRYALVSGLPLARAAGEGRLVARPKLRAADGWTL
ncbi:MAG: DNA packaging protein [Proteobacteria bacterium]|nr:DNA packaging protein [Pseudomonadota bacterium]